MSKTGEAARTLSARVIREPGAAYGPGRPPVHVEEWTKVTVVLLNRQIVFPGPPRRRHPRHQRRRHQARRDHPCPH